MSNPLTELILDDGSSVFIPYEGTGYELSVPMEPQGVAEQKKIDSGEVKNLKGIYELMDVRKFRWVRGYNTPAGKVNVYKEVVE